MDLSRISNDDLIALKMGDLSRVSDAGLKEYKFQFGKARRKEADPSEYDSSSPEYAAKFGPTSTMGALQRLRAGFGQGMTNLVRGAGQVVGAVDRQDVADSRELDASLNRTTSGKVGNILGTVAGGLPAAFIPGANTYAGAAAIGAGLGALQPSTSTKETLTNTAVGGVLSPAAMLAGRGLVAGARGLRSALIDPFTKAGQERIASSTLQAFAGGADEAAKAAQNIQSGLGNVLPGAKPTTAELANNAGLANLERILKNNPEFTQAFASRAGQNRNAIVSAVDSIAGDDLARSAAVSAREAASSPLYKMADEVVVQADDALAKLLKRPSMSKAWDAARNIAAENGEEISQDVLSGRTLHYLKLAMDDLSNWSPTSAIGKNEAGAIGNTKTALLEWMDKNIPAYGEARAAFREGSKPINQMDVGQALRDKLLPALSEFGAETRLRPEAFAQAMRSGDATASRVMGRPSSITDILSPDQIGTLDKVGQQLARRVNADELGKAVGSNTGQNLVGQNVLRQFLGPLGLPQTMTERAASGPLMQGILGAPAKLAEKVTGSIGEPNILRKLVELGLSPEDAIRILSQQINNGPGMLRYQGAVAPIVSGAYSARQ